MMKVLVVESNVIFRRGLANLLDAQPDIEIVGQGESVQDAVTKALSLLPDLLLIDFRLPDGTGLDATRAILALQPAMRIIFLTSNVEDSLIPYALQAGAAGFVSKEATPGTLLDTLRSARCSRPSSLVVTTMTNGVLQQKVDETLSQREVEVLEVLLTGATNQQIAGALNISINTVKIHVSRILSKLGYESRRDVIRAARTKRLPL